MTASRGFTTFVSFVLSTATLAGLLGLFWLLAPAGVSSRAPKRKEILAGGPPASPVRSSRFERAAQAEVAGAAAGEDSAAQEVGNIPAVSGRVLDPDGGAIPGARIAALSDQLWLDLLEEVQAESPRNPGPSAFLEFDRRSREITGRLPQATSDEDGSYAFHGLAAGQYRLLTRHDTHVPAGSARVCVETGRVTARDIVLARGETLSGVVVDGRGRGIPGAEISARPSGLALGGGLASLDPLLLARLDGSTLLDDRVARSGRDGSFRLAPMEPIFHDLTARRAGFAPATIRHVAAGAGGLVLVLDAGASVEGRILGASGERLTGACVEVLPLVRDPTGRDGGVSTAFDTRGAETPRSTTDGGGRFRLAGLAAGSYELCVTAGGHPRHGQRIDLEGGLVDLGDILLEKPLVIQGTVRHENGAPAAQAEVWAVHNEARNGESASPPPAGVAVFQATSDSQGLYSIDLLPPGTYTLRARAGDDGEGRIDGIEAGTGGVGIVLQAGLVVAARVLDARTLEPIPEAPVCIVLEEERWLKTDGEGYFEARGIPRQATWRLGGEVPVRVGGATGHTTVAVSALKPEETPLAPEEIFLEPDACIRGTVVDAERNLVVGARVSIDLTGVPEAVSMLSTGCRPARSGLDGTFEMTVPASLAARGSRASIVASHPRQGRARIGIAILWPLEEPVEIVLASGATVRGHVKGTMREPLAGALVRARRPVDPGMDPILQGRFASRMTGEAAYTDAKGSYRLDGLDAGEQELEVSRAGYAPETLVVMIGEGDNEADFILGTGSRIDGRVVDGAGHVLGDVQVIAFAEPDGDEDFGPLRELVEELDGGDALATTGPDGRFVLDGLGDGAFTLVARGHCHEPARVTSIRAGETVGDVVLSRLASLAGTVTERESGRPVSRFHVTVAPVEGEEPSGRPGGAGPREFAARGGLFACEGLRAGKYDVLVTARDHAPSASQVVLAPGEEESLKIALDAGSRVDGTVVDAGAGAPIEGVRVTLQALSRALPRQPSASTMTDRNGSFSCSGLAAGRYAVMVHHVLYLEASATEIELPAEEAVELRLERAPASPR